MDNTVWSSKTSVIYLPCNPHRQHATSVKCLIAYIFLDFGVIFCVVIEPLFVGRNLFRNDVAAAREREESDLLLRSSPVQCLWYSDAIAEAQLFDYCLRLWSERYVGNTIPRVCKNVSILCIVKCSPLVKF